VTAKRARRARTTKAVLRFEYGFTLAKSRGSGLWMPRFLARIRSCNQNLFKHWHPDLRHWDWRRMDGKRGFW